MHEACCLLLLYGILHTYHVLPPHIWLFIHIWGWFTVQNWVYSKVSKSSGRDIARMQLCCVACMAHTSLAAYASKLKTWQPWQHVLSQHQASWWACLWWGMSLHRTIFRDGFSMFEMNSSECITGGLLLHANTSSWCKWAWFYLADPVFLNVLLDWPIFVVC